MGGAIGKGNITPAAEFNIYFDPKAYDIVLKSKGDIPLVMIPLELTHTNLAI
jgi:inosine-uridine nucleoside N-ribohydrolase